MAEKVLIVEDENIIALELTWQLEGLGYQVVGVISRGKEAIYRAAEKKPDLILMDIRLKGELDGFQTAEAIQAQSNIPIVYLSALVDDKMLERFKSDKSASFYLPKPFTEGELKETIENVLHGNTNCKNLTFSKPIQA
ncbi:MAG: response regulator [Calditrichaeota bacterium]|nr:response regulator [Calditrichota bacterium]